MCDTKLLLSDLKSSFRDCGRPTDFLCDRCQDYYSDELREYLEGFEYGQLDVEGLKGYEAEIFRLSPEGFRYVFQDLLAYALKYACEKRVADWYVDIIIIKINNDLEDEDSIIRTIFSAHQLHCSARVIEAIVECEKKIERPGVDSFKYSFQSFWIKWL
jgi:hypothetical protein